MKKVLLGALALVFVVIVAGWWVFVRPWTAWPGPRTELDARWAKVEAWAGNPPVKPDAARPETLRLGEDVRKLDQEADDLVPAADDSLPPLTEPTEGTRAAIDAIVTWHGRGAPIGSGCAPDLPEPFVPPIEVLRAGRATIASAGSAPDDPRMEAVLHLASELRQTGSLLEAMVGVRLAADAAATAKARGIAPNDAFLRFRPRREEVFPTIARDFVCGYRWVRDSFDKGDDDLFEPRPILARFVSMERELLMVRTFHADLLHQGLPHRDDPRALAAAVRVEREDLPKSLLVRAFAADLSSVLTDWADAIERYDAFVDGGDGQSP